MLLALFSGLALFPIASICLFLAFAVHLAALAGPEAELAVRKDMAVRQRHRPPTLRARQAAWLLAASAALLLQSRNDTLDDGTLDDVI